MILPTKLPAIPRQDETMSDINEASDAFIDPAEAIFTMAPQEAVWSLARLLVGGQRSMRKLQGAADSVRRNRALAPELVDEHLTNLRRHEHLWYSETLPSLIASFQLAVEVYDTFGPDRVCIDDPLEAALWNNKAAVWSTELGGPAFLPSDDDGNPAPQ